jgi:ADP-ribosylglycohydrolase
VNRRERALGAFYGLAVGDALGMPTQSMSRERIAERYGPVAGMLDAVADQPIAPGMPAGSITDDTEQAVLLARLLVDGRGRVDPRVFADALIGWEADMIRRGSADLLGPSTKRALTLLESGVAPEEAGLGGATNGAAMRVTPIGIAFPPSDALLDAVVETGRVTHNSSIGLAAAAAVGAAVSAGVDGASLTEALDEGERAAEAGALRAPWAAGGSIAARIRWARRWVRGMDTPALADALSEVIGTSVSAQESVVAAFALAEALGDSPREALLLAAGIGGDTDTIAAMCGAMLGAHHGIGGIGGIDGIPADFVGTVRRVNSLELEPVVDGLLELRDRTTTGGSHVGHH